MWKYRVEGEGLPLTDLSELASEIQPLPEPPVGVDMPPVEIAEDVLPYGGTLVSASRRSSRVIAVTFAIVCTSLAQLSARRRLLHGMMYSRGGKRLYVTPGAWATPIERNYHVQYRTLSSETRMTGPFSCEVTYRLHTEWSGWRRLVTTTPFPSTTLTTNGVVIYELDPAQTVTHYIPTSVPANPRSVVAVGNEFWVVGLGGAVTRYSTTGAVLGTSTVPVGNIVELVVFWGQPVARSSSANTLYRWNGSAWAPWGPTVGGGFIRSIQLDATGAFLILTGTFTTPRKGVMALDSFGTVVSSEVFPSAGSVNLSSAIAADGMALYGGVIDGVTGIWSSVAFNAPATQIATLNNSFIRFTGNNYEYVYATTNATTCNGGPTGGLLRIRAGSAIRPVAEGVGNSPRWPRILSDGRVWVVQGGADGRIYRIVDDGLQIVARGVGPANSYQDVARIGNRICVVGEHIISSTLTRHVISGGWEYGRWIARLKSTLSAGILSIWRNFDDDIWTCNPSILQEGRVVSTDPAESEVHGSATNWRYSELYTNTFAPIHVMRDTISASGVDLEHLQEVDVL